MKKELNRPFVFIIYGPTGVGKTNLALAIAQHIPAEIINMDMGQFYTPLSIGTAKPDWKNSSIPHHLFDIIDTPRNYTVAEYRKLFHATVNEIVARGNLPIAVGGSAFYVHSLFFLPQAMPEVDNSHSYNNNDNLWEKLYVIDPVRAAHIAPTDTYRIKRALSIWHTTGKLPSSYNIEYKPEIDYLLLFLQRDRQELHKRIDDRVMAMMNTGWIAETEQLLETVWQPFLEKKKLIGYSEIFNYLIGEKNKASYAAMIELICIKTRQYAKRQFTFWHKLEREIKEKSGYTSIGDAYLETVNLTNISINIYIDELIQKLSILLGKRI